VDNYAHHVSLEKEGKAAGTIRAKAGEQVQLQAKGWIQNKDGDTSIHQLLLALDTTIIGEVYCSVPGQGDTFEVAVSFQAPSEPGTYMIWRFNDLQYGMDDAKSSFAAKHTQADPERYPGCFTAWLLVGADTSAEATQVDAPAEPSSTPVPAWARADGFDGEHCALVREYFKKHAQETPDWLEEDEAVWKKFEEARAYDEERRKNVDNYAHHVSLEKEGKAAGTIRAKAGEQVQLQAKGWIQNKDGDTSIHQLLLALDTTIIGEVYCSVPGQGDTFEVAVSFQAPSEPGTYMIWRFNDLQYGMEDAKNNFGNKHTSQDPEKYPGCFTAWLVVA